MTGWILATFKTVEATLVMEPSISLALSRHEYYSVLTVPLRAREKTRAGK